MTAACVPRFSSSTTVNASICTLTGNGKVAGPMRIGNDPAARIDTLNVKCAGTLPAAGTDVQSLIVAVSVIPGDQLTVPVAPLATGAIVALAPLGCAEKPTLSEPGRPALLVASW